MRRTLKSMNKVFAIGGIILGIAGTATAQTSGTNKKTGVTSHTFQMTGGNVGRMEEYNAPQTSGGQFTFSCHGDVQSQLFDWMKNAICGTNVLKKDCNVVDAGYDGNVVSILNLRNTTLVSMTMPALDATSKGICKMQVVMNAESTATNAGNGQKIDQPTSRGKVAEWTTNTFSVSMSDQGDLFSHITNIDAITISPGKGPRGTAGASSLKITCMCKPDDLKKLEKWFADVIKQNTNLNNPPVTITSTINYMDNNNRTLFTVTYQACPFKITEQGKPNTAGMQAVVAEFYSKDVKFAYN